MFLLCCFVYFSLPAMGDKNPVAAYQVVGAHWDPRNQRSTLQAPKPVLDNLACAKYSSCQVSGSEIH